MKAHGKGQGITINGGTSNLNHYKQQFAGDPLPVREWKPLKCWPVARHPRQDDIDAFKAIRSVYS